MYNRHQYIREKKAEEARKRKACIETVQKKRRRHLTQRYVERLQQWMLEEKDGLLDDQQSALMMHQEESALQSPPDAMNHSKPFSLAFKAEEMRERHRMGPANVAQLAQIQHQDQFLDVEPFNEEDTFVLRQRNPKAEIQDRRMRFDSWKSEKERRRRMTKSSRHRSAPLAHKRNTAYRLIAESMSTAQYTKPIAEKSSEDPQKWLASQFSSVTQKEPTRTGARVSPLAAQEPYSEKYDPSIYGMTRSFDLRAQAASTAADSAANSTTTPTRKSANVRRNSTLPSPSASFFSETQSRRSTFAKSRPATHHGERIRASSRGGSLYGSLPPASRQSIRSTTGSIGSTTSRKSYFTALEDYLVRSTASRGSNNKQNLFLHESDVESGRRALVQSGRRRARVNKKKSKVGRRKTARNAVTTQLLPQIEQIGRA